MTTRSRLFVPIVIAIAAVVVNLATIPASASHINEWDFENPIDDFSWSNTTRTQYGFTPTGGGPLEIGHYLGPLTTTPLELDAIDVFDFATGYPIAFDLLLLPAPGLDPNAMPVFSVTSHGQVLLQTTTLSEGELIGSVSGGGAIYRFESLFSAGPVPVDPLSGCCGDVQIEWALSDGAIWGIDNVSLVIVPEPSTGLLVALGLGMGLAVRSRRRTEG